MQPTAPARKRPFQVLPPITRGPEALDGAPLLEEIPGDLGLLLWQSLRNVRLWAEAEAEERPRLFSAAAAARRAEMLRAVAVDDALRPALEVIHALLADPGSAEAAHLSYACARVTAWTEEKGAPAAALAFAQAAALASPADAALACAVGRLARLRGETARAEGWYHKAIVLARARRDWRSYTLACMGLGNVAVQRGNLPSARRHHLRALRTARRHRLRAIQGLALHDLLVTAAEMGDAPAADGYAADAVRAYGEGHPRLPVLAHDVAVLWMARGEHSRALPVLRAVLPHFRGPAQRAVAHANLACAAGGAGRADLFRDAALETVRLVLNPGAEHAAAQAYLNLARGAVLLGDAGHARAAADQALRLSRAGGQGKIQASAELLLERLEREGAARAEPFAAPVDLEAPGELAGQLVRALEPVPA